MTRHHESWRSGPEHTQASLSLGAFDQLMPLHLVLDAQGMITHLGPTLRSILGPCLGQSFFHLFKVSRPAGIGRFEDLCHRAGEKLVLTLHSDDKRTLRGQAFPEGKGGLLVNLSFGMGVVEAVRRHALTISDFAITDLAVEMLYLVEAKNAVHDEFRKLSSRLEGARYEAEERAMTDTLTGLRNRRAFDTALSRACDSRMDFALMHLDLDKFKAVNDTLGHAAGDHVLRAVSLSLKQETRGSDTVARVGGDEFVILLPALVDEQSLLSLANRLIQKLSQPIPFEDTTCQIGASIGIVTTNGATPRLPDALVESADQALYAAKRAGRGQAVMAEA